MLFQMGSPDWMGIWPEGMPTLCYCFFLSKHPNICNVLESEYDLSQNSKWELQKCSNLVFCSLYSVVPTSGILKWTFRVLTDQVEIPLHPVILLMILPFPMGMPWAVLGLPYLLRDLWDHHDRPDHNAHPLLRLKDPPPLQVCGCCQLVGWKCIKI